jgi:hypothetical protein
MKKLIFLLALFLFTFQAFAHVGGHGTLIKSWKLIHNEKTIQADFLQKEGDVVYLVDKNHEILKFNIIDFSKADQNFILEKANWISLKNTPHKTENTFSIHYSSIFLFAGLALLLFVIYNIKRKSKTNLIAYSILSAVVLLISCKDNSTTKSLKIATNNIAFLESVFGVFDKVTTRHDNDYFYIESDGIPEHEMMTGITNWQQQVPINHDYSGDNAWAIPLQPELATTSLSTKDNFMKGAIAIAANGIPIFNPLNNRGEDANVIGELDKWGGHCGRADDYHYHLPPSHLQAKVGANKPIAYALDGFPVYGETTEQLDENLGRFTSDSTYQYHAVKEYPYLIAAMKGKVKINPRTQAPENEIMPQAKTKGVRPDLKPLRGAAITDFKNPKPQQYSLTYTVDSLVHVINYGWENGNYSYEFVNPDGTSEKTNYQRK